MGGDLKKLKNKSNKIQNKINKIKEHIFHYYLFL